MKLNELSPAYGSTKKRKRVGRGGNTLKQLVLEKKDKMLEVAEALDQDLKVDNYHYSEDLGKEDSTIQDLQQYMQILISAI